MFMGVQMILSSKFSVAPIPPSCINSERKKKEICSLVKETQEDKAEVQKPKK